MPGNIPLAALLFFSSIVISSCIRALRNMIHECENSVNRAVYASPRTCSASDTLVPVLSGSTATDLTLPCSTTMA